jgi:membrane-bound metal-dependent hydrolase YbcI (DUF457 family)
MAFAAAVVPVMLTHHLQQMGLSHEIIILIGAALYLLIRFGGAWLLQRFTVHRGMFHSLPAAAIFGEIGYLLASGDTNLRLYKAGAVVLGYMSHLILDEIWSIEWAHGLHFKSSFGTALKLYGHKRWANVTTFTKLAVLTLVIFQGPKLMQKYQGLMADLPGAQTVGGNQSSKAPQSTSQPKTWPWR